MLFDERPKISRSELFDRENDIKEILANIHRPLLVITGIRRISKTSLMNVALREANIPFI